MSMGRRFMFGLAFAVLTLFFAASLVQADALDDLIGSYSFDYDSGEINIEYVGGGDGVKDVFLVGVVLMGVKCECLKNLIGVTLYEE